MPWFSIHGRHLATTAQAPCKSGGLSAAGFVCPPEQVYTIAAGYFWLALTKSKLGLLLPPQLIRGVPCTDQYKLRKGRLKPHWCLEPEALQLCPCSVQGVLLPPRAVAGPDPTRGLDRLTAPSEPHQTWCFFPCDKRYKCSHDILPCQCPRAGKRSGGFSGLSPALSSKNVAYTLHRC